ncbi:MAG: carboxypeptidase regulatory-like domain-containing protein, partial [Gammaproteobacteria bacterium]
MSLLSFLARARWVGLLLLPVVAPAQEFRATVVGNVTDAQGAAVVGAKVEVRSLATAAVTATVTNESGAYVAPFLPVGIYSVAVSADGFKRAVRENVELRVGDRLQIDFRLEVGAVAEQITVVGDVELLETTTASKGQVIDSIKVASLPLLGRNPFLLAAISAGVQYTPSRQSRSNRPFDNGGMDNFSMNGGRQFTNEFLLDGVPDTNTETTSPSNLSFVPSPDATEEFKVQTNTYDSQYGRTGGGVINVSLKSGGNKLHGTLYHYFRNDKLNANAFESNATGVRRSAFHWNQPGVMFSGPVSIPKIYDGRNRTFFMYSWEKIKSAIPFPQTYTVPTLAERAGDFSPIAIYDPLTTVQSGTTFIRQPFANNRIPQERFDPVARKLLDYIPTQTNAGNAQGFFNLVASPNPVRDEYDQHIVRIDQVLTAKHRFYSRYVRGNRHEVNSDAGYKHEAAPWYAHWRINQGGNFDLTSTLSPTLISSFRAGYIRHQFAIAQYGE